MAIHAQAAEHTLHNDDLTPPQKMPANDYPIHALLAHRWSPYCFDEQPLTRMDLNCLFEAARWSASSYNDQPWRYLVALREDAQEFAKILSCLVDMNQVWAGHAAALALGVCAKNLALSGKPNAAAQHDLGAASASLTLEAAARGIAVHQMIGILPDRASELFAVPPEFQVLTALALGYPGRTEGLPEELKLRDAASRQRKKLGEFVFRGQWGQPAK